MKFLYFIINQKSSYATFLIDDKINYGVVDSGRSFAFNGAIEEMTRPNDLFV
jgi:hypothetical protein